MEGIEHIGRAPHAQFLHIWESLQEGRIRCHQKWECFCHKRIGNALCVAYPKDSLTHRLYPTNQIRQICLCFQNFKWRSKDWKFDGFNRVVRLFAFPFSDTGTSSSLCMILSRVPSPQMPCSRPRGSLDSYLLIVIAPFSKVLFFLLHGSEISLYSAVGGSEPEAIVQTATASLFSFLIVFVSKMVTSPTSFNRS